MAHALIQTMLFVGLIVVAASLFAAVLKFVDPFSSEPTLSFEVDVSEMDVSSKLQRAMALEGKVRTSLNEVGGDKRVKSINVGDNGIVTIELEGS